MGIYTERKIGTGACIAILCGAFAVLYGVWLFVGPELMRSEVLFASAAAEFSPRTPLLMKIHGWATPECMPLLPAAARLIRDLTGAPMASVLRGLSMLMLGAGAALVYFAAGGRTSPRPGLVAAAMYSSCFLALGTAIEGTPATSGAFFLAAAQMVFFQYGVRRSDWNRAWVFSALLVTLGFLSGGFMVLVFFIFPMFFFRRPLSVSSKFRRPGFAAAVIVVAVAVLLWSGALSSSQRQISLYDMWWRQISEVSVGWGLLAFPFELIFWLLPWSLIAWLPFCVALQALDDTPIYSRYLRTLAFSSLALLWLLPELGRFGLFYALMPLSVLTGRAYELGMRRYGGKLRRCFVVVEVFMAAVPLVIAFGCVLSAEFLAKFFSLGLSLGFRDWTAFLVAAPVAVLAAVLLALYVHWGRLGEPVWLILLAATVASALFFNIFLFPYKSQDRSKREFGSQLREALPRRVARLYTRNVRNLNGGLFYAGIPVYRLGYAETFPTDDPEVWLLSVSEELPQFSGYSGWTKTRDFVYNGHSLTLWNGRRISDGPEGTPKTDDSTKTEGNK